MKVLLLIAFLLLSGCDWKTGEKKIERIEPVETVEKVEIEIVEEKVIEVVDTISVLDIEVEVVPDTSKVVFTRFSNKYDKLFIKYARLNLPFWDWKWLKAQCYQESLLNPKAVSPVGAMGLCQFMPGTWEEVKSKLRHDSSASAFDPELSIEYASYYNAALSNQWKTPRPDKDRRNLVFASYNAGLGNILRAQSVCDNATLYDDIMICLPTVTGRHSKETITYVERINRWFIELQFE